MDVDDSANVDNEQLEGERTRTRDNNLMELFDDENNAIVLFLVRSEFYVWILESSNCESVDILLRGSLGDGDEEMYFKLGQSGVSVFGIMSEFVPDSVFNYALIWKRLIRSRYVLPARRGEKKSDFPIPTAGYSTPIEGGGGKDSMPESMHFPGHTVLPNSVDQIRTKLWPRGNHQFREITHTYNSNMMSLAQRIIQLIMLSLGLAVSKYYKSDLFTNIGILTILYQDDVGGLQIRTKEGCWIDVKPSKRSFVVNLGDCLQMWSNCRYRSAEHRVVYGGLKQKKNRLSIAFFFTFEDKVEIKAPEELIHEEHPKMYNAAKFGDIIAQYIQLGPTLGASNYFLI
ncbi:probable 2-oxoglutarate-dependent dioxygenase AOP1 [Cryptomeria japonica]|uniref:probable 2-oxoglutarate-dependent dioxygenase AOP1 n=1 Tax=Cryptomeria japonica TaxID=3369 RepID=UPI0027DA6B10|nr:probable 2-oxoglutarate-dependent dioxygenase AOP1 [Cryptomeria japonica]